MAAGPAPLLPAEAEALVRSLRGTELRDTGGQGCEGTALLEARPAGGGPRLWVSPEGLGGRGARGRASEFGVSPLGLWGEGRGGGRVWGPPQRVWEGIRREGSRRSRFERRGPWF